MLAHLADPPHFRGKKLIMFVEFACFYTVYRYYNLFTVCGFIYNISLFYVTSLPLLCKIIIMVSVVLIYV
jgi:hypothetical protein